MCIRDRCGPSGYRNRNCNYILVYRNNNKTIAINQSFVSKLSILNNGKFSNDSNKSGLNHINPY